MGMRSKKDAGMVEEKPPSDLAYERALTRELPEPSASEVAALGKLDADELQQLEGELITRMRDPEKQAEAGLKDLAHALRCVALVLAMRVKLQMEKSGEGRMIGIEELEARLSEEAL